MPGTLTIRRAHPTETDTVATLLLCAFAEFEREFYWPNDWDAYLHGVTDIEGRRDRSQLWVADLDASLVGSVDYYPPATPATTRLSASRRAGPRFVVLRSTRRGVGWAWAARWSST